MTADPAPLDAALVGIELHAPVTLADLAELRTLLIDQLGAGVSVECLLDKGDVVIVAGQSEQLRRTGLVRRLPIHV